MSQQTPGLFVTCGPILDVSRRGSKIFASHLIHSRYNRSPTARSACFNLPVFFALPCGWKNSGGDYVQRGGERCGGLRDEELPLERERRAGPGGFRGTLPSIAMYTHTSRVVCIWRALCSWGFSCYSWGSFVFSRVMLTNCSRSSFYVIKVRETTAFTGGEGDLVDFKTALMELDQVQTALSSTHKHRKLKTPL